MIEASKFLDFLKLATPLHLAITWTAGAILFGPDLLLSSLGLENALDQ